MHLDMQPDHVAARGQIFRFGRAQDYHVDTYQVFLVKVAVVTPNREQSYQYAVEMEVEAAVRI